MTDEAVLGSGFGFGAFLADELANFVIDKSLIGLKIITTFVSLAVTLGADKNFEALVNFFDRNFSELGEANVAVGLEDFLVELFVSG